MSGEGPNSAVRPMLVPIIATRRARSAAVGTPLKARAVAVSALGAFPQFSVPYHDAGSASVRTTPQGRALIVGRCRSRQVTSLRDSL